MLIILNCLLSAVCIVFATTAFLTERLKYWMYAVLMFHVAVMAWIGLKQGNGHLLGIPMILLLLIMIGIMVRRNKIENVGLACAGYLGEVVLNNLILYLLSKFLKMSVRLIEEKYLLHFSLAFLMIEGIFVWVVRKILYEKREINRFMNGNRKIKFGLIWNLMIFAVIFVTNIVYGKKAGYSMEAMRANCILFVVCMGSSSILIVECAKSIRADEIQKAEEHQKELMRSYIEGMEYILDEQRAFRHDYKNMLVSMSVFIRERRMTELEKVFYEQVQAPIEEIEKNSRIWINLKNIYPMEFKGFLYEKVLTALSKNIRISLSVYEEIDVSYTKMNELLRIIGVFVDNAIEAAEDTEKGVVNLIFRKTERGILIRIENNFRIAPDISSIFERGYSTKGSGHGNGLYWTKERMKKFPNLIYDFCVEENMVIQQLEMEK